MYKLMLTMLVAVGIFAAACSGGGESATSAIPSGMVNIVPASNFAQPINLSNGNLYPGGAVTLTASESGYFGGFSAVAIPPMPPPQLPITGGNCISAAPVTGTTNEFTAASVSSCGGQKAMIAISDSLGHSSLAYVTNN